MARFRRRITAGTAGSFTPAKRRRFSLDRSQRLRPRRPQRWSTRSCGFVQKLITLLAIVDFMRHDGKPPLVQKNAVEVQDLDR